MSSFKEMLHASFKSEDTEEWIDIYFTRPIGLVFALMWRRLGVHPNVITVLSIFLGVGAGWMFWHTGLMYNITGVVLLMLANFCDSTDGQLARLTGQKTLVGRVLDGFSGDLWFFSIYFAICCRLMGRPVPGTEHVWGVWIWVLAFMAGVMCHSRQSSLADYYRQIHLFFLKGKEGSELDTYAGQRAVYESLPRRALLARAFYYNYANYCRSQERRTPRFQKFISRLAERCQVPEGMPPKLREEFLAGSRPLMKYTNILTFNVRAVCIYVTCIADIPWLYLLIEITLMSVLYVIMHKRHETLCAALTRKLDD